MPTLFVAQDLNVCASLWRPFRPTAYTHATGRKASAKFGNTLRPGHLCEDLCVSQVGRLVGVKHRTLTNFFVKAQNRDEAVEDTSWAEKVPSGVIHNEGDVIAGKYTIVGVLGQGGLGITYDANTNEGEKVALKAMSLRNMKGWKDLELFEREARVLKSLQHPGIAEYMDYFQVDTDIDRSFYIAQKVAKGKSLGDLVESGWLGTEEDVKRIAIEVLGVLQYLGDLRPPVIHRDIKPENIILDKETGMVKVVDFGAVQNVASGTLIGSTVVGTYGYMAPEQFQNRSTLQTDLYGLGGTMLYLLSGRSPSYFPQRRLKVDFRMLTYMSPGLADIIEQLLEPAPEDRFQSAGEAINALKGLNEVSAEVLPGFLQDGSGNDRQPRTVRRPAGTKVELKRINSKLDVTIPPAGLAAEMAGTSFTVAWNAFLAVWTGSAIAGGAPVLFTLFSLPFWVVGFGLAKTTFNSLAVSVSLKFEGPQFSIEWSVGDVWKHQVVGQIQDISSVDMVVEEEQNGRLIRSCRIVEGVHMHNFGRGLENVEMEWIVQEIRSHLLKTSPLLTQRALQFKELKEDEV